MQNKKVIKPDNRQKSASKPCETENELFELIKNHIEVVRETKDKIECHCVLPEHEDNKPSAVFLKNTEVYTCLGCGAKYSVKEIAQKLHWKDVLNYLDERKAEENSNYFECVKNDIGSLIPNNIINSGNTGFIPSVSEKELVGAIFNEQVKELEKYNGDISKEHKKDIFNVASILVNQSYFDKQIVISGQPSWGKTTLLKNALVKLCDYDKSFGAVFAVRTLKDAQALCNAINQLRPQTAYCLEGWNKDICQKGYEKYFNGMCRYLNCPPETRKKCKITTQYLESQKYPVVIITHERLIQHSQEQGRFKKDYQSWNNGERSLLIIDEKIRQFETVVITENGLDEFMHQVNGDELYDHIELNSLVNNLRNLLDSVEFDKFITLQSCINLEIPTRTLDKLRNLDQKWQKFYEGLNHIVEGNLFKKTALNSYSEDDRWQVGVSWSIPFDCGESKIVIFDGTSSIDVNYSQDKFIIYNCQPIRDYSNVEFHLVKKQFSKTKMKKETSNAYMKNITDYAISILERNPGKKMLFLCHKEETYFRYRDLLKDYLVYYYDNNWEKHDGANGIVYLEWFGNLIGRNDLSDTQLIFMPHIMNKSPLYYACYTHALGIEIDALGHERINNHFFSSNSKVQAVTEIDQVVDTVQNIMRSRLRCYKDYSPVHIYLFSNDNIFVDHLANQFPDSKLTVEHPHEFELSQAKSMTEKILNVCLDFKEENPLIQKKQIVKQLGITSETLKKYLRKKEVKEILSENGFEVNRHNLKYVS